ncbi:MAG: GntR family transcriptional regulator, partial [Myxococcales bacterium]|nr:GntR family transcriptional regulator [Myxococcales bacterium]
MVNKALQPQGTLPDRIADELIARVFTGELQPGDTLPAERALAASLGVDRTSLRIAMRQLTRMRL